MPSTTHSEFDGFTDALKVASSFPSSIKGRTILITGVNKLGVGYATAEAFASQAPSHLILAGRSTTRVEDCFKAIHEQYPDVDVRLLQLDLSSQHSVREAAEEVMRWEDVPTIDLVINNAGAMNIAERTISEDGLEMHFATNHIGHFLFTGLIMPKILAAAKDSPPGVTRIVNLSSSGTIISPLRPDDLDWVKPARDLPDNQKPNIAMMNMFALDVSEDDSYIPAAAYGHSKTCNVLHAVELNKKLYHRYGVSSLALNPGEMQIELGRHTDKEWLAKVIKMRAGSGDGHRWKSLAHGASTTMVAALDPKLEKPADDGNGQFLTDCQVVKAPPHSLDTEAAAKLWEISEGLVGENFEW